MAKVPNFRSGRDRREITDRERRATELVAQGLKNEDIAKKMGTTENMVKNLLRKIYDKLGLWNRVELALHYEKEQHDAKQGNRKSFAKANGK